MLSLHRWNKACTSLSTTQAQLPHSVNVFAVYSCCTPTQYINVVNLSPKERHIERHWAPVNKIAWFMVWVIITAFWTCPWVLRFPSQCIHQHPVAYNVCSVLVDKSHHVPNMPLVPACANLYSQLSKQQCGFSAFEVLHSAYLSERVNNMSSIQWLSIAGQSLISLDVHLTRDMDEGDSANLWFLQWLKPLPAYKICLDLPNNGHCII